LGIEFPIKIEAPGFPTRGFCVDRVFILKPKNTFKIKKEKYQKPIKSQKYFSH